MPTILRAGLGGLALLVLLSAPAAAQSEDEKLEQLLEELDALIDKGEKQNLADPWFLQELEALSSRYGEVWPVVLFDHRFDSKGSLPKAPWEVRQGQMKMDWSRGLRSRVEVAPTAQAGSKSDKEVVGEIIGGLLGQALGSKGGQTATADPTTPALALAPVAVSNAFQLQAEVTARAMPGDDTGGLELGVYQGSNAGYRLLLTPKAEAGAVVKLLAVSSRGTSRLVASGEAAELPADDLPFTLTLSRRPDGAMTAALGEQQLFAANDQSFKTGFDGVLIANRAGDYAVKWMTVRGTK
jgi:hypothetical protein